MTGTRNEPSRKKISGSAPCEEIGSGHSTGNISLPSRHDRIFTADGDMQADIGCSAVYAVIFGDGDFKRCALGEPQRTAQTDHDARVGERSHTRSAVGRGMSIELCRQAQTGQGPPGHAEASEDDKSTTGVRKSLLAPLRPALPGPWRTTRCASRPIRAARPRFQPRPTPQSRPSQPASLHHRPEASHGSGLANRGSVKAIAATNSPPRG